MQSTRGSVYRIGTILVVAFFIICTTTGVKQGLAAQPKTWKPNRPLKIILSSYGGAYDLIARQLARVLPDYLGQKVIVEAVTGTEGKNALDALQRSKPDGHTFSLLGLGAYIGLAAQPATRPSLYSWNVLDLPIILAIDTPPYVAFGSPKSPYFSYEDIMKMKKVVRIAVAGTSFGLMPLLLDFDNKGIQYKVARFKGFSESSLAVIAGNADLMTSMAVGVVLDQVRAGDIRALWVYDAKRFSLMPNTPTHGELKMPKEWSGYRPFRLIQVPPGTQEYIQKALTEGLIQALKDKRTVEWSKKSETPVDIVPEKELRERMRFLIKDFKDHPQIVETYF